MNYESLLSGTAASIWNSEVVVIKSGPGFVKTDLLNLVEMVLQKLKTSDLSWSVHQLVHHIKYDWFSFLVGIMKSNNSNDILHHSPPCPLQIDLQLVFFCQRKTHFQNFSHVFLLSFSSLKFILQLPVLPLFSFSFNFHFHRRLCLLYTAMQDLWNKTWNMLLQVLSTMIQRCHISCSNHFWFSRKSSFLVSAWNLNFSFLLKFFLPKFWILVSA